MGLIAQEQELWFLCEWIVCQGALGHAMRCFEAKLGINAFTSTLTKSLREEWDKKDVYN